MLDFLFNLGQAASALLLLYGGYLAMTPLRRKAAVLNPEIEDELLLLKHLHDDV